jgi:hypothetical protein
MDRSDFLQSRRGRYLAQTLEEFERTIEPLVPVEVARDFKALVRRKFGALAKEAVDLMELDGEMNGIAQDMKDRIHTDSAPARGRR